MTRSEVKVAVTYLRDIEAESLTEALIALMNDMGLDEDDAAECYRKYQKQLKRKAK